MSSGTDLGSNSKMADFKVGDFLSGDITATGVKKLKKEELILVATELDAELQVENIPKAEVKSNMLHALTERSMLKGTVNIPKAEVKSIMLHALTERSMMKGTVKPVEMTEMQFQLETKS